MDTSSLYPDQIDVFAALKNEPPVTRDGHRITVRVNAGLRDDLAAAMTKRGVTVITGATPASPSTPT